MRAVHQDMMLEDLRKELAMVEESLSKAIELLEDVIEDVSPGNELLDDIDRFLQDG